MFGSRIRALDSKLRQATGEVETSKGVKVLFVGFGFCAFTLAASKRAVLNRLKALSRQGTATGGAEVQFRL